MIKIILIFFFSINYASSLSNYAIKEVEDILKSNYIKQLTEKELTENAIKGMINNLDPHSIYLDSEMNKAISESLNGEFVGIGIEFIKPMEDVATIISPLHVSPAMKAGIMAKDKIIKIDGKSVFQLNILEMRNLIQGEENTEVELEIYRENTKKTHSIKIKRAKIKIDSIKSDVIDNKIGYIKIISFTENTYKDFNNTYKDLLVKNNIKGLIIDLRNNPGGLLTPAVKIADLFLEEDDLITVIKGRNDFIIEEYRGTRLNSSIQKMPIAILMNEGSASSSEILSAALIDHKVAFSVGSKTFGKGSVQAVIPLSNQLTGNSTNTHPPAVKLTFAKYYTPSGKCIDGEGIMPQYIVNSDNEIVKKKKQQDLILNKALEILNIKLQEKLSGIISF